MNRNEGFTLIELLIVIGIIGLLTGIAAPGYIAWSKNAQFKDAAQTALSTLRQAKGQAINLNQNVTVLFTLDASAANDTNSLKIGTGPTVLFKKGIEIMGGTDCDSQSPVSIAFNPNGSSQTGYVCIFDGANKKYRIGIATANTGRVRLQKWQAGNWK